MLDIYGIYGILGHQYMLSDYSYFESVIERLQQAAAAQAKQESDGNESIAVTREEDMVEQADDAKVRFLIFIFSSAKMLMC